MEKGVIIGFVVIGLVSIVALIVVFTVPQKGDKGDKGEKGSMGPTGERGKAGGSVYFLQYFKDAVIDVVIQNTGVTKVDNALRITDPDGWYNEESGIITIPPYHKYSLTASGTFLLSRDSVSGDTVDFGIGVQNLTSTTTSQKFPIQNVMYGRFVPKGGEKVADLNIVYNDVALGSETILLVGPMISKNAGGSYQAKAQNIQFSVMAWLSAQ